MEGGSELVVVFTKEHKLEGEEEGESQVVARVSVDIRAAIKSNRDKIFIGFNSHHVTDRFYQHWLDRVQHEDFPDWWVIENEYYNPSLSLAVSLLLAVYIEKIRPILIDDENEEDTTTRK